MATQNITTCCPLCTVKATVKVPTEGYRIWKKGIAIIQDAMPRLSVDDREQLMTGICPTCWGNTIGEEEVEQEPELV